jgi:O-antigen ligase
MMLCITADQFRKIQWLRWLSVAFLTVGTLSIVDTIIGTDQLGFLQVRPLFPTWFLALALSVVFFHRKIQLWIRILLLFVAGLWCFHLFIHQFQWLSTWIPSMVCIMFLAFMRSKPLFFALMLIVIVIALFNLPTLESYVEIEMAISGTTRWDAWLHNWTITRDHWLFGVGPAGYALYYMTYFPSNAMATHSNYIDVLSQTGVVGFLFFIVLLAGLGVELWRSFLRHRGAGDLSEAFSAAVFGGYLSVLLAMALGDWILPFVYTQTIAGFNYALYSWVMLGAGLGLSRTLRDSA